LFCSIYSKFGVDSLIKYARKNHLNALFKFQGRLRSSLLIFPKPPQHCLIR